MSFPLRSFRQLDFWPFGVVVSCRQFPPTCGVHCEPFAIAAENRHRVDWQKRLFALSRYPSMEVRRNERSVTDAEAYAWKKTRFYEKCQCCSSAILSNCLFDSLHVSGLKPADHIIHEDVFHMSSPGIEMWGFTCFVGLLEWQ